MYVSASVRDLTQKRLYISQHVERDLQIFKISQMLISAWALVHSDNGVPNNFISH